MTGRLGGGRRRPGGSSAARPRRRSVQRGVAWLSWLSVALLFLAWWLIHALALIPDILLPGPGEVFDAAVDIALHGYRETTLWQNMGATLWRCGAGFALAVLTGVPLGLAMGYWPAIRAATNYVVQFMRPLPPLSYVILLIIWLGTGDSSKVVLLYLTALPIVASSAMAGVWTVKEQRLQAARSLGASEWQIFCYVVFPSALPLTFTGARIALAAAFSTVVAAELNAATDGLGWMVISASRFLRNDVIILGILLLGLLGILLSWMVLALDRRIVHWRGVE